jgi:DNA-binding response OmpR family regulator
MPALAMRILVVEDEWLIADQVAEALTDAGYTVVGPAGEVSEALVLVRDEQIDAALIDINVDGDRTFGLAAALAKASVPFAFLSGYSKADLPANLRARPLLQKPVDGSAVCRCVRSLLQS